jgi:hypothetical protein
LKPSDLGNNILVKEMVESLPVKCLSNLNLIQCGCLWNGKLSERDTHMIECIHSKTIPCALATNYNCGCNGKMLMPQMVTHLIDNAHLETNIVVYRLNRTGASTQLEPSSPHDLLNNDNRDIFIGQTINCIMQGHGVLINNSKHTTYIGAWRCNQRHGEGKLFSSAYCYSGQWYENKIHGFGTITMEKTKNVFNGEFVNGCLVSGTATYLQKGDYSGTFQSYQQHGFGDMIFVDGSSYFGEWRHGKFDGEGRLQTADGEVYEGHFKENMKQGKGKQTFNDGSSFKGMFIDNSISDVGVWNLTKKRNFEVVYID